MNGESKKRYFINGNVHVRWPLSGVYVVEIYIIMVYGYGIWNLFDTQDCVHF